MYHSSEQARIAAAILREHFGCCGWSVVTGFAVVGELDGKRIATFLAPGDSHAVVAIVEGGEPVIRASPVEAVVAALGGVQADASSAYIKELKVQVDEARYRIRDLEDQVARLNGELFAALIGDES